MMTDKRAVQPHNTKIEGALIGAALLNPDVLDEIALPPDAFFLRRHELIWAALLDLRARGDAIDVMTVADVLERHGVMKDVGGMGYLMKLITDVPTSMHAQKYAETVAEDAMRRRALSEMERCAVELFSGAGDAAVTLEACVTALNDTIAGYTSPRHVAAAGAAADVAIAWMRETERRKALGLPLSDAPMPFLPSLNAVLFPRRGNFIIIAARPKVGKTAFLLTWALSLAEAGKKVALFSMEMGAGELGERLISMLTGINTLLMRRGELTPQQHQEVEAARKRLNALPLVIIDKPGLHVDKLPQIALAAKRKMGGLDVVMVDYLGLLDGNGRTEYEQTTYVTRRLKHHARFLDVVLVSAQQLNRGVGDRQRPEPRHLRASGQGEQDVDALLFLYRYPEGKEPGLKPHMKPLITELALNRAGVGTIAVPSGLNTNEMRVIELQLGGYVNLDALFHGGNDGGDDDNAAADIFPF